MIAPELLSNKIETLKLIGPDIERDPPLSVEWMAGDNGRETQSMMGIPDREIHEHSLEEARGTIAGFIESDHEIVWMIEYAGDVVGAVEIHMIGTKYLPSPSIHVMLGDVDVRGRGIGRASAEMAITYLQEEQSIEILYSRYRTNNKVSEQLLLALGFEEDGDPYEDQYGMRWQNVIYRSEV